jgi:hypothetical protein
MATIKLEIEKTKEKTANILMLSVFNNMIDKNHLDPN